MVAVRWRFTLAHELAHLVMYRIPSEVAVDESQANTFAIEFLMPEGDIKSSLLPISLGRLARLKLHWRVSMQALLKRAGSLRLITPRTERYYFMLMSKMGMREVEPHESDIPMETPSLLRPASQVNSAGRWRHRENIFHWLPQVKFFQTWEEARDLLGIAFIPTVLGERPGN